MFTDHPGHTLLIRTTSHPPRLKLEQTDTPITRNCLCLRPVQISQSWQQKFMFYLHPVRKDWRAYVNCNINNNTLHLHFKKYFSTHSFLHLIPSPSDLHCRYLSFSHWLIKGYEFKSFFHTHLIITSYTDDYLQCARHWAKYFNMVYLILFSQLPYEASTTIISTLQIKELFREIK